METHLLHCPAGEEVEALSGTPPTIRAWGSKISGLWSLGISHGQMDDHKTVKQGQHHGPKKYDVGQNMAPVSRYCGSEF